MESLHLIGTVHLDPDGYTRLVELLHALRPECVTVDVSQYAIEFRRGPGSDLLGRLTPFRRDDGSFPPGLEAVAAQLALPFEYQASEAYAERTGARVMPIGDSLESQRLLGLLTRELMVTDNLLALATRDEAPLAEQVEREWQRARRHKLDGPPVTSQTAERFARQDAKVARQVRERARVEPTAHVCGWEHLRGLTTLLEELEPEALLLNP
jgi:hypothetical protein